MKMTRVLYILILTFLISSCTSIAQPAFTPIPTFTATSLPTLTSTATATPTHTPLPPTETPGMIARLIPHGQPVNEWNGIPVMPGAIAGESDAGAYRFTTMASSTEIQAFYEHELADLGWELLGVGEGETGGMIIIFFADEETVSISILPNQDTSIVMIVK